MVQLRLALVSALLAACAMGVISASAASAAPVLYKIELTAITKAAEVEFLASEAKLLSKIVGLAFHLICKDVHGKGTIEPGTATLNGKSKMTIVFTKCEVTKPAGCKVKEPIEVINVEDLLVAGTPLKDLFLGNGATKKFTELTITGCTTLTAEVTGEQECQLPNAGEDLAEHEIQCLATESKLKLGANPATFETTVGKVKLVGADKGKVWNAS